MNDAMICSDCGFPVTGVTERTLRKGSAVREPGEALCASCNSSRMVLVRSLDRIPNTLDLIRAKRMVHV